MKKVLNSKKNVLIMAGIMLAVVLLACIVIVVVKNIRSNKEFEMTLPDPALASTMYQFMRTDGTVYFTNQQNNVVLVPTLDFKPSDISGVASSFSYMGSDTVHSISAVILKGSGGEYANMLISLAEELDFLGTVFYPSKISKDALDTMKAYFPDTVFIEADKVSQYVLGDYVLYFENSDNMTIKVTYGYYTYLLSDVAVGGGMAGTEECDVAIMPYDAFSSSKIECKTAVFPAGTVVDMEILSQKASSYLIHPGRNTFSMVMHRMEYMEDIVFECVTLPTGKLEEVQ